MSTLLRSPTLLASVTLVVWKALQARGINSQQLFTQAGLDTEKLNDPDARYTADSVSKLWRLAVDTTNDPCFGLSTVKFWHPSNLHALGYAWLASETLKEAFQRVLRYFRMVSNDPEKVGLEQTKRGYLLHIDPSTAQVPGLPVEYDATLALVVEMCRISFGDDLAPIEVRFQREAPVCADRFFHYFGCNVQFETQDVSVLFKTQDMEKQLPTANQYMARACDQIIDEYLSRLNRQDVSSQVRAHIIEQLPSGHISEKDISETLHMSVRSMQRKLKQEGTSYKQLLNAVRRQLAVRYVEDGQASVNEMTYMLGYSEPANFSRAYKRWTGRSPTASRSAKSGSENNFLEY